MLDKRNKRRLNPVVFKKMEKRVGFKGGGVVSIHKGDFYPKMIFNLQKDRLIISIQ